MIADDEKIKSLCIVSDSSASDGVAMHSACDNATYLPYGTYCTVSTVCSICRT